MNRLGNQKTPVYSMTSIQDYPYYPFLRLRGSILGAQGRGRACATRKMNNPYPLFFVWVIRVIRVISRPRLGLSLTHPKQEWVIWVIDNP